MINSRALILIAFSLFLCIVWQTSGLCAIENLVAAWNFNQGTGNTVKDISGNGHNGSISGAKWVQGKFGKALKFNGDGDQVLVPHSDKLNLQKGLTVEAWIYPTGWNPDLNAIAQKWEDGSNRRQYQLTVYKEKNWWYATCCGDKWKPRAEGQINVKLAKWIHLAGTYDGKKLRNYTNGKLDIETADMTSGLFASEVPVAIGGYGPKTKKVTYGQNRHFMGIIDEVRIWGKALSEKEIRDGMKGPIASVKTNRKLPVVWGDIKYH